MASSVRRGLCGAPGTESGVCQGGCAVLCSPGLLCYVCYMLCCAQALPGVLCCARPAGVVGAADLPTHSADPPPWRGPAPAQPATARLKGRVSPHPTPSSTHLVQPPPTHCTPSTPICALPPPEPACLPQPILLAPLRALTCPVHLPPCPSPPGMHPHAAAHPAGPRHPPLWDRLPQVPARQERGGGRHSGRHPRVRARPRHGQQQQRDGGVGPPGCHPRSHGQQPRRGERGGV